MNASGIRIEWTSRPMSVHHEDEQVLTALLDHLREEGLKRHSIIMPDRANGSGFTFFIYEEIDAGWVRTWEKQFAEAA